MSKTKKIVIGIFSVLLIALIVALSITLSYFSSSNKGPYTGMVINQTTGQPISEVLVSDGRNVVKTDDSGSFTLKGYLRSRFITVTTPSGYECKDFYIPISKETKTYDFKLTENIEQYSNEHSFIQISDTEIGENGVGEWIDHLKGVVDETKPAFLIHTGDICYEAGLKKHIEDMNTDNMGVPVHYVIGNHDYVDGKYGEELYESLYGPIWYSFDVGNVHYIVTPIQNGDYPSGYTIFDRWKWLKNDLAAVEPDKKIVLFNHDKPNDYELRTGITSKLNLRDYNLIAWAYGHFHSNHIKDNRGVLEISTGRPDAGGIDQSLSGPRQISVDKNDAISSKMFYYDFNGKPESVKNSVWSTQLEGIVTFCDTLIVEDNVYVATVDDGYPQKCGVYSLDAKTGKINWFFPTINSVRNDLIFAQKAYRYEDEKENGSPINAVYAQDCDGNVYCIDAQTGESLWETGTTGVWNTTTGICIVEDKLIAGSSANVYALDINSGKPLNESWLEYNKNCEGSAAEFVHSNDQILVSAHWNALVALDAKTGRKLWENKDEHIRFRGSTPAIIDQNDPNSEYLVADSNAIMLLNRETGEITSKTVFEEYSFGVHSQPVIVNNTAYIATVNKGIVAFDLKTREIVWETPTKRSLIYTAQYSSGDISTVDSTLILTDENTLLFGASDGFVYTININDGKILTEKFIGAPIFSSANIFEDSVIVSDAAGRVSRIK